MHCCCFVGVSFFPGKFVLAKAKSFLKWEIAWKLFVWVAKVLSDAPAAGHNLIRKIARHLATAFCFKAFHLSASACQHGDTSPALGDFDTSHWLSATPVAVNPEALVTGVLYLQMDSRSHTVMEPLCNTEEVSLVILTCSAHTSSFLTQQDITYSTSRTGF